MKSLSEMWEDAHKNTASIITQYMSIIYICKKCNDKTEYKATLEMQQLGNQLQNIVTCKKCNNTFIRKWGYGQLS